MVLWRQKRLISILVCRLDTMHNCDDERAERDLYLKFLTLSLNHGKLVPPFNKLPMPGLRPLSTVMPRSVHNLIYKGKYVTGECRPPEESGDRVYSPAEEIEPGTFFSRQPVPKDGGVVYAAAFSTKNPWKRSIDIRSSFYFVFKQKLKIFIVILKYIFFKPRFYFIFLVLFKGT